MRQRQGLESAAKPHRTKTHGPHSARGPGKRRWWVAILGAARRGRREPDPDPPCGFLDLRHGLMSAIVSRIPSNLVLVGLLIQTFKEFCVFSTCLQSGRLHAAPPVCWCRQSGRASRCVSSWRRALGHRPAVGAPSALWLFGVLLCGPFQIMCPHQNS